ncbi:MAG: TIGR02281 family clan AA aspartic protease [Thioalkalivibrio sp.]
MRRQLAYLLIPLIAATCSMAMADQFHTQIDMDSRGGATFYVAGSISGHGAVDMMVDTGSGYMTINEEILGKLRETSQARFVRTLRGRLANGSELEVPVYALNAVSIGNACWLRNVEAAVFPGNTRPILGLNVLQRTGPFIFSFDPPRLLLSQCNGADPAGIAPAPNLAAFGQ